MDGFLWVIHVQLACVFGCSAPIFINTGRPVEGIGFGPLAGPRNAWDLRVLAWLSRGVCQLVVFVFLKSLKSCWLAISKLALTEYWILYSKFPWFISFSRINWALLGWLFPCSPCLDPGRAMVIQAYHQISGRSDPVKVTGKAKMVMGIADGDDFQLAWGPMCRKCFCPWARCIRRFQKERWMLGFKMFQSYPPVIKPIKSMFFQQATFDYRGGPGGLKQNIKSLLFVGYVTMLPSSIKIKQWLFKE